MVERILRVFRVLKGLTGSRGPWCLRASIGLTVSKGSLGSNGILGGFIDFKVSIGSNGNGEYIFTPVCVFVCLCLVVSRISQKVINGFR